MYGVTCEDISAIEFITLGHAIFGDVVAVLDRFSLDFEPPLNHKWFAAMHVHQFGS